MAKFDDDQHALENATGTETDVRIPLALVPALVAMMDQQLGPEFAQWDFDGKLLQFGFTSKMLNDGVHFGLTIIEGMYLSDWTMAHFRLLAPFVVPGGKVIFAFDPTRRWQVDFDGTTATVTKLAAPKTPFQPVQFIELEDLLDLYISTMYSQGFYVQVHGAVDEEPAILAAAGFGEWPQYSSLDENIYFAFIPCTDDAEVQQLVSQMTKLGFDTTVYCDGVERH